LEESLVSIRAENMLTKNEKDAIGKHPAGSLYAVLMMVQNIYGLLSFWTMSIARYSKEHNVSETGHISVLW
jgi:hypothetical protein